MSRLLQSTGRSSSYLAPASTQRAVDPRSQAPSGQRLDVIMAGPGLTVMGGISAVERLILSELPAHVRATHIATMVDGGSAKKLLTFARALWRYRLDLAQRPDLVHIHFASGASSVRKEMLARIALRRGCKVIMHAHGGAYRGYMERMSPRRRARVLAMLNQAGALIVLGEAWREFFISVGVPAWKIVVMPNPVRLPAAVPQRPESPTVTCACLGYISARKGTFDLVEAAALLPPEHRARLRLVIAGNGALEQLRDRIRERNLAGSVQVVDWIDASQRDALLASAHVFALPSYVEGLPMALLEAMAFGAVPISTPVGSIGEVVRDGVNGLLIPPGDVPALAAALQRLIERPDERAVLATQARAAVEPYGIDAYVDRLCRVYRAVANGDAPGVAA